MGILGTGGWMRKRIFVGNGDATLRRHGMILLLAVIPDRQLDRYTRRALLYHGAVADLAAAELPEQGAAYVATMHFPS